MEVMRGTMQKKERQCERESAREIEKHCFQRALNYASVSFHQAHSGRQIKGMIQRRCSPSRVPHLHPPTPYCSRGGALAAWRHPHYQTHTLQSHASAAIAGRNRKTYRSINTGLGRILIGSFPEERSNQD